MRATRSSSSWVVIWPILEVQLLRDPGAEVTVLPAQVGAGNAGGVDAGGFIFQISTWSG